MSSNRNTRHGYHLASATQLCQEFIKHEILCIVEIVAMHNKHMQCKILSSRYLPDVRALALLT